MRLIVGTAPVIALLTPSLFVTRPVHRMWKVKWESAAEMNQWEAAVQKRAKEVRELEETRNRQRQSSRGGGGAAR